MNRRVLCSLTGCVVAATMTAGARIGVSAPRRSFELHRGSPASAIASAKAAAQVASGTIEGHIMLTGLAPANPIIRMGVDPRCSKINAGRRFVQETVIRSENGGLVNAYVHVAGSFPQTPAPSEPVTIDQQGCIYRPRVAGARVGQTLQIQNSDQTLHNLHSLSTQGNDFNVSQPQAGMVYTFELKHDEVMLRLKCDVHSWMTLSIGVVSHPYFAVTGDGGAFRIAGVPAGNHTIRAWHERYGPQTQSVTVKPGEITTADFTYTGTEKPGAAAGIAVQEMVVPAGGVTARLVRPGTLQ